MCVDGGVYGVRQTKQEGERGQGNSCLKPAKLSEGKGVRMGSAAPV